MQGPGGTGSRCLLPAAPAVPRAEEESECREGPCQLSRAAPSGPVVCGGGGGRRQQPPQQDPTPSSGELKPEKPGLQGLLLRACFIGHSSDVDDQLVLQKRRSGRQGEQMGSEDARPQPARWLSPAGALELLLPETATLTGLWPAGSGPAPCQHPKAQGQRQGHQGRSATRLPAPRGHS